MDNSYNVLLQLYDKSEEATAFADELEAFICDLKFNRQETDFSVKNLPLLVVVKKSSISREVLQEIDEDISNQSHEGVVIIVYFWTHPSERSADIEHDFKVIKYIIGMDFKKWALNNVFDVAKPKNDRAREEIRYACKFRRSSTTPYTLLRDSLYSMSVQKKTVLLYDHEKSETSKNFTEALENFIPELQCQHYEDASEEEKHTLPIVAVVRSTSLRLTDELNETADLLKGMLVDLGAVIVVYFKMDRDESLRKEIASSSDKYSFSKVIDMDFSGSSLQYPVTLFGHHIFSTQKSVNTSARKGIQLAYTDIVTQKAASVNVYYKDKSSAANQFLKEVGKHLCSKINLQEPEDIGSLKHTCSATVIYITKPLDNSLLKGHNKQDLRNVVVFRIFDIDDIDDDSNNGNMDDESTQSPKPDVPQKVVEFYNSEYTEKTTSQFGLYYNILLGNTGQKSSCNVTMLQELETFISERNSIKL